MVSKSKAAAAIMTTTTTAALTQQQFVVRSLFLRALSFVYAVAFLVAWRQNKALIGDHGITPARNVLDTAQARGRLKREYRQQQWKRMRSSSTTDGKRGVFGPVVKRWKGLGLAIQQRPWFQHWRERLWDRSDEADRPVTTLFWLARNRRNGLDKWLDTTALTGLVLSLWVLVRGAANVPVMVALWLCQRSIMAVGGEFYGYGWEPQLAELGFHAIFLVPLWKQQANIPVPAIVSWAIRWYLFRIMMGAGLIKIRGNPQWRKDLSAMDHFYETQPVPNPLSKHFHWSPPSFHKFEVLTNHFVELVAPWLLLMPFPTWRRVGGLVQIAFQSVLITSGNFRYGKSPLVCLIYF